MDDNLGWATGGRGLLRARVDAGLVLSFALGGALVPHHVPAAPPATNPALPIVAGTCVASEEAPGETGGPNGEPEVPGNGQVERERRPLVYLTREDRREAGVRHEILPWLTVAGLLESEFTRERLAPVEGGPRSRDRELANALQFAAEIKPSDWSKIELIYEYEDDDDHNRHVLDEAVLSLESGDFEWEAGRLYVPFGEYFSQFVEGPVLEFGETRAAGMNLSWSPEEVLDLKVYAYEGRKRPGTGNEVQWGFAAEVSPTPSGTLGFSYISNITDAQDSVVDIEDLVGNRDVGGISGYAVFGLGPFEVNAEFVTALDHLQGPEPDRDRPLAWNTELAWFPGERYQLSFRLEGTREIADEPRHRVGIGGAWWVAEGAVLRLEYLYGKYKPGLAEDDLERDLDHLDLLAAQLSVEF